MIVIWLGSSVFGLFQQSFSTLGSVSTGMGSRLWAGKPSWYVSSHPGHIQRWRWALNIDGGRGASETCWDGFRDVGRVLSLSHQYTGMKQIEDENEFCLPQSFQVAPAWSGSPRVNCWGLWKRFLQARISFCCQTQQCLSTDDENCICHYIDEICLDKGSLSGLLLLLFGYFGSLYFHWDQSFKLKSEWLKPGYRTSSD